MEALNPREYYARYFRYYRRLRDVYQKRPEVRASVELLLTLLSISFFLVAALRPTLGTIAALVSDIKSGQEVKEKLETKVRALETAQLLWSQEEARLALLDQALSPKPSPQHYLGQVEGLSSQSGVVLSAINFENVVLLGRPEESKEEGLPRGIKTQKVTLVVSGDYSSLISFLEEVENMRQILKTDSVNFQTNPTVPGGLLLTISGLLPYFQDEGEL